MGHDVSSTGQDRVAIEIKTRSEPNFHSSFSQTRDKRVYCVDKETHPVIAAIVHQSLADITESPNINFNTTAETDSYVITIGSSPTNFSACTCTGNQFTHADQSTVNDTNLLSQTPSSAYFTTENPTTSELLSTRLFGSSDQNDIAVSPTPSEKQLLIVTTHITETLTHIFQLLEEFHHVATTSNTLQGTTQSDTVTTEKQGFVTATKEANRLQWVVETLTEDYVPLHRIIDAADATRTHAELRLSVMDSVNIVTSRCASTDVDTEYKLSDDYTTWKNNTSYTPAVSKREFIITRNTPEETLQNHQFQSLLSV